MRLGQYVLRLMTVGVALGFALEARAQSASEEAPTENAQVPEGRSDGASSAKTESSKDEAPSAKASNKDGGGIEQITITAQKRRQSAQDVGISVTAIQASEISNGAFTNAQELTSLAVGVGTIQPNGEANYAIAIRGVANSDFTTNVESPVAIYVDEVYISQMSGAGFQLFDMERVEFLRGPQGTLFGRNATGGLAHFVTRKPTEAPDGYVQFTYGRFTQVKAEAAVGGAVIPGLLSVRASGAGHWNSGYVDNRLSEDNLNNANDQAGRLQLLLTPAKDLSLLVNVRAATQDIRTGFFENASSIRAGELTPGEVNPILDYVDNDGDVFAGDYNDPGFNKLDTFGATATLNWKIAGVDITSITDYQTVTRDYIEDSDASPVSFFNFFLSTDAEQISQELRIAGGTDWLNWVAGFYYLNLETKDANGFESEPFGDGVLAPAVELEATDALSGFDVPYTTKTESWSLFGQAEFQILKSLSATLGFRWIQDRKEHSYSQNLVDFLPNTRQRNGNPNVRFTFGTYEGERDDGIWSARVGLNWKPLEDILTYASWNRGVKGGAFNSPIFPPSEPLGYDDATFSYDPEQLDAFEVGFKSRFLGRRLQLNASAYYYDYKDYQAFQIIGIDTITSNADATSMGFEAEVLALPIEGLFISAGVAYTDVEVDLGNGTPKTTSVQTPKWNVNGLIRYELPLLTGILGVQFDADWRDEHFFALTRLETVTEDGYVVANASISWTSGNGVWSAAFYVRNLFDEEYLVQTFDLSGEDVFGLTEQYYGRPQWWGLSLQWRFDSYSM